MSGDYTVRLEQLFQGPMDLLLHLVREQEVEIHEVEISRIVDGYLGFLNSMERMDIEFAGDFLVMAATLMAIKSRSLLPHEELDLEDELDPKDELIQRLLEYRRFRAAADDLAERFKERSLSMERGFRGELAKTDEPREFELGELTSWDLLAVYSRLMRETLADQPHEIITDPRPLRFYVEQVVDKLRSERGVSLQGLLGSFGEVPTREALIGSFCALLELVRMELVEVDQEEGGGDISIAIRAEHTEDLEEVVRTSILDEEEDEAESAAEEHETPAASAGAEPAPDPSSEIGADDPAAPPAGPADSR